MTSTPEVDPAGLPPGDDPGYQWCGTEESAAAAAAMFGLAGAETEHAPIVWLIAALTKWHVKFTLVSGYATRGRPASSGGFAPRGYLIHHTGTTSSASKPAPSLGTVISGRTDLPGPLCQVSTAYDGTTYVVALGRANHAGVARASGSLPGGDGNALYVGNEVQTSGVQPMPAVQRAAVVRVGAAVCDALGVGAGNVALHATTSVTGKWDLGDGATFGRPISLAVFQAEINALLQVGPGEEMALTTAENKELFYHGAQLKAIAQLIADYEKRSQVRDAANTAAVTALAGAVGGGLDPADVIAAVTAAVEAALAGLQVTLTAQPHIAADVDEPSPAGSP